MSEPLRRDTLIQPIIVFSLPDSVQAAVCSQSIRLDDYLYAMYWNNGTWCVNLNLACGSSHNCFVGTSKDILASLAQHAWTDSNSEDIRGIAIQAYASNNQRSQHCSNTTDIVTSSSSSTHSVSTVSASGASGGTQIPPAEAFTTSTASALGTPSATQVLTVGTHTSSSSSSPTQTPPMEKTQVGAIVGGVVSGVAGGAAAALAITLVVIRRRRRRRKGGRKTVIDIVDDDPDERQMTEAGLSPISPFMSRWQSSRYQGAPVLLRDDLLPVKVEHSILRIP